jgi:hypothetical protein
MKQHQFKTMNGKVADILSQHPECRDDDRLLVVNIWYAEMLGQNIEPTKISAKGFFNLYANEKLPIADLITRARRKVQEENPKLRGNTWETRHKEEEKVRKYI